jgi:hypothetical protein
VKGTKTETSKKEGRESKNPDTTGSMRGVCQRKFRSTWEERVQEKEKLRLDLDGNEDRENRYWMEGKERRCRMCYEERETIEHWNGCSEMKPRERKERGEILNEDGKQIGWMKQIWNRRDRMEKERGGG